MVNITSIQMESEIGSCIVYYSWSSPWNLLTEEISHYLITFDTTSMKVGSQEDVIEMVQPVHTCTSHSITIIAVDICGRKNQPRNHEVKEVSNINATVPVHGDNSIAYNQR